MQAGAVTIVVVMDRPTASAARRSPGVQTPGTPRGAKNPSTDSNGSGQRTVGDGAVIAALSGSPQQFGSPQTSTSRARTVGSCADVEPCPHCGKHFDVQHQRKCAQRPVRCSACMEVMTALTMLGHLSSGDCANRSLKSRMGAETGVVVENMPLPVKAAEKPSTWSVFDPSDPRSSSAGEMECIAIN